MELLIVMLIITVLAALSLAALQGVTEEARADRTRAIIAKLDQLIMDRWEGYRTRTLPITVPAGTPPRTAALRRLVALHELMRMELPERQTDIINLSTGAPEIVVTTGMTNAALQRSYYRKVMAATGNNPLNWNGQNQGAECLYLIVSSMQDGDKNALDFFMPSEIGDTDQDGMMEILDGWGTPLGFLRWAPGYTQEQPGLDGNWGDAGTDDNGNMATDELAEWLFSGSDDFHWPMTQQTRGVVPNVPPANDYFDPVKVDARGSYALKPLIFSAGRDKAFDINVQIASSPTGRYTQTSPVPNDPYTPHPHTALMPGTIADSNGDGDLSYQDNITNHYQDTNAQ
jgi:hypothetical protein